MHFPGLIVNQLLENKEMLVNKHILVKKIKS